MSDEQTADQKALLEFVKARGFHLIPRNFKDRNFSEDDLMSGKLDFSNLIGLL